MAFDLSTAKPVQQKPTKSGGFDMSTAKPVQDVKTEGPDLLEQAASLVTGNDRETRATRELPELSEVGISGLLSDDASMWQKIKATAGTLFEFDPEDIVQIIKANTDAPVSTFYDEKGNVGINVGGRMVMLNKPGATAMDALQAGATAAAFTPAGRAGSVAGAAGASAATELGLQAGKAAVGGDEVSYGDVAGAAALGGGLRAAEKAIGTGYRALKGKMEGPEADLVAAADQAKVPLYTSDVRPPQNFASKSFQQTAEKLPLVGTASLREGQQDARVNAVGRLADKYGQFSYSAIVDSLKATKDRVKNAAGSVLESAGNKLDDVGEMDISRTREAIKEVQAELSRPGRIASGTAQEDLKRLVDAIDEAPQTFTSLKENRTAFSEIVKGADKAERTQLTSRAKSLLGKVKNSMTADMQSFARSNLSPEEFAKWNRANAVYAEEANKLTRTRLKSVLDKGDVTPEAVEGMLFSKKPSEVRSLYQSLSQSGRENAKAAIISKVVRDLSRRQSGFTPNSFNTELKKYEPQIEAFFKGADKRQLEGLRRVLQATTRAQDAAVTTPTGQQLLGAGTIAATAIEPITTAVTAGSLGGLSRFFESRGVRNALVRLGSVPRGSTRFEQALDEAVRHFSAASQTARSSSEDTK